MLNYLPYKNEIYIIMESDLYINNKPLTTPDLSVHEKLTQILDRVKYQPHEVFKLDDRPSLELVLI